MADEPNKRKKRLVKNPETFRERAVKASEETDKPQRLHRARSLTGGLFGPVFRPVWRLLRLLGRIIFPRYLRNSWKELRLVSWPSRKQSRQLTGAVLAFAIVFGAAIALVDYGLDKVFKHILLK